MSSKIHTFYLTEAQRNNAAYLLGVAASKLREEKHGSGNGELDWMITDAENLQSFFELRYYKGVV